MLRQNMLHQNNDTPIFFNTSKFYCALGRLKFHAKGMKEKNMSLPQNIRNIAKSSPCHAKIRMIFSEWGKFRNKMLTYQ